MVLFTFLKINTSCYNENINIFVLSSFLITMEESSLQNCIFVMNCLNLIVHFVLKENNKIKIESYLIIDPV